MTKAKRYIVSLMLVVAMSLTVMPAQTFATDEGGASAVQNTQPQTQTVTPAPTRIIKKGKNLYYKQTNGKIRKKKGFFTYAGNRYYTKRGGKIVKGKTFKVGKYRYRAYGDGKIAVGVYSWGGKLYFSDAKGRWAKIKSHRHQKGVVWNGNWYFLQTNSQVATNRPVVINNLPYVADASGVCTPLGINETASEIVKVARPQIGKHTKSQVKGFWNWYSKRKFVNTDITPWCGTFVGWCYKTAGKYNLISSVGNIAYVPRYTSFANRTGKWVNRANAREGDIIVFGKNRHVGIVERVYNGYIYTIEGNSGPTAAFGTRKPGAVTRRVYAFGDKDIKGVIHP